MREAAALLKEALSDSTPRVVTNQTVFPSGETHGV